MRKLDFCLCENKDADQLCKYADQLCTGLGQIMSDRQMPQHQTVYAEYP